MSIKAKIASVANFFFFFFREMTYGLLLCVLIILKLVILFLVLRLFFFKPVLAGQTEEQKSDFVGERLTEQITDN